MFYVSDIQIAKPSKIETELQEKVYAILSELNIPFERDVYKRQAAFHRSER